MDHQTVKQRLDAYLDGELPASETGEIAGHIQTCPGCRKMVEEWEKIRAAFFKTPEITPSNTFTYQVMARLETAQAFDLGSFLRWAFSTFAFMACALFFISFWPPAESSAFEAAILKGNPFNVQDVAADIDLDATGLEAL